MNQVTALKSYGKKLMLAFLLGQSSLVAAEQSDCWVEIYEFAEFIGKHIRLSGPLGLANLRDVKGENWESRIDSLIVGPSAEVTIFENTNYKLTLTEMAKHPELMKSLGISEQEIREDDELIFKPNQRVNHLGIYNFHKKTKSLKIKCLD